jgi:predicted DsbA family dithiol-disulfide isomerase
MDPDVLIKIAAKHNMMTEDEALAFFASNEYEEEVAGSIAFARKAGIKGVPFTIIENKWALSGVQQEAAFIQIFKKLAQCSGSLESCPGTPSLANLALPSAARVQVQ